jgi:hypothetical protein
LPSGFSRNGFESLTFPGRSGGDWEAGKRETGKSGMRGRSSE